MDNDCPSGAVYRFNDLLTDGEPHLPVPCVDQALVLHLLGVRFQARQENLLHKICIMVGVGDESINGLFSSNFSSSEQNIFLPKDLEKM